MNRKDFLLLAGGGFLVSACEKQGPAPTPPLSGPGSGQVITYLSADLTQELLTVGSIKIETTQAVWVQRIAAGNTVSAFKHFSLRCTHAGCLVAHQASSGEFHCPCHGSKFTATGAVLAGPAARSLDQYVLSLQGTTLLIKSA